MGTNRNRSVEFTSPTMNCNTTTPISPKTPHICMAANTSRGVRFDRWLVRANPGKPGYFADRNSRHVVNKWCVQHILFHIKASPSTPGTCYSTILLIHTNMPHYRLRVRVIAPYTESIVLLQYYRLRYCLFI